MKEQRIRTEKEAQPIPSIAWLGPRGNFTHLAAQELQKIPRHAGTQLFEMPTITDMFESVSGGLTTYALVPVENSTDGHVADFHKNLLVQPDIRIVGEIVLSISQTLYYQDRDLVQVVASKDSALGQTKKSRERFFGPDFPTEVMISTGAAVRRAAHDPTVAAIGSPISAEEQKLDIFEKIDNFNDKNSNATTFALIQNEGELPEPTGNDKTTFIMTISDGQGSLASALSVLAGKGVDLNKIKSIDRNHGTVSFLVSADGHMSDGITGEALDALELSGVRVKRLGSYPKAEYPTLENEEEFDFEQAISRIQDEAKNGEEMDKNKTIVVFTLHDKPGALLAAIKPFADAKVNLTKIDSQPSGIPNEHIFYLAFDNKTHGAAGLIDQLGEHCHYVAELQRAA